jgi:dTDP-4-dehydrorhamnose reductase
MRILLFGKLGQLGWELRRTLAPLGEVMALDFPEIDLTDPGCTRAPIRAFQPQVIINATAYTAVDRAESEPKIAEAINGYAPGVMAEEARAINAALIHYSTDYVFDGTKSSPYNESDTPNPLGVYGRSKLNGERAIQQVGGVYLILRTSWVYSLRRESFVTKVLQWARQKAELRIVSDQISNPTWARMLAEATAQIIASANQDPVGYLGQQIGRSGSLYHLAGDGYASRFQWAQAILANDPHPGEQIIQELIPAMTADFPTPAKRPLYSALNTDKFAHTFELRLPNWKDSLSMAME